MRKFSVIVCPGNWHEYTEDVDSLVNVDWLEILRRVVYYDANAVVINYQSGGMTDVGPEEIGRILGVVK